MSDRTSQADLARIADTINREAPDKRGHKYVIEYAYGRPVLFLADAKGCGRNISPRLPKGRLAEWLWAFLEGVRAAKG